MAITDVYGKLFLMEKSMVACEYIHTPKKGIITGAPSVDMTRFSCAELTRAFNHLQSARMYAGSIARVFGKVTPYANSFKGKAESEKNEVLDAIKDCVNLNAIADDRFLADDTINKEIVCLSEIRKVLAHHPEREGVFYEVLSSMGNILTVAAKDEKINTDEVKFHIHNLMTNIQDCTNLMDIRFGKIVSK